MSIIEKHEFIMPNGSTFKEIRMSITGLIWYKTLAKNGVNNTYTESYSISEALCKKTFNI